MEHLTTQNDELKTDSSDDYLFSISSELSSYDDLTDTFQSISNAKESKTSFFKESFDCDLVNSTLQEELITANTSHHSIQNLINLRETITSGLNNEVLAKDQIVNDITDATQTQKLTDKDPKETSVQHSKFPKYSSLVDEVLGPDEGKIKCTDAKPLDIITSKPGDLDDPEILKIKKTLDIQTNNSVQIGNDSVNQSSALIEKLPNNPYNKRNAIKSIFFQNRPSLYTETHFHESVLNLLKSKFASILESSKITLSKSTIKKLTHKGLSKERVDEDTSILASSRKRYEKSLKEKAKEEIKLREEKNKLEEKEYLNTIKTLTNIFDGQLLYYDSTRYGYEYSGAKKRKYMTDGYGNYYTLRRAVSYGYRLKDFVNAVAGDGHVSIHNNFIFIDLSFNIDARIVLISNPTYEFREDSCLPYFVFPEFNNFKKLPDNIESAFSNRDIEIKKCDTLINYFGPLLQIVEVEKGERINASPESLYSKEEDVTLRDIFNWETVNPHDVIKDHLVTILNNYYKHSEKCDNFEKNTSRSFRSFLNAICFAFIHAFHHFTNLKYFNGNEKFSLKEVYTKFVEFFLNCSFIDLGHHFLNYINFVPFDYGFSLHEILKFNNSLNSVCYLNELLKGKTTIELQKPLGNNLKKLKKYYNKVESDRSIKGKLYFLFILSAIVQSKYTYGFILRLCLFKLSSQVNSGIPRSSFNKLNLDSNHPCDKIVISIRNDILRKLKSDD